MVRRLHRLRDRIRTHAPGRAPVCAYRSVAVLLLTVAVASATGSLACGSPSSTAEQTQTAATGAGTPTATLETTPQATSAPGVTPAIGDIVVTDLSRLNVNLVSPAFSPDGSAILGGDAAGLEVGLADGTQLRAIEPDVTSAVWSPDSKTIAVTVVHGGLNSSLSYLQPADLVVMNADGSSRVDVGKSDFPTYVQFLTDGRLAYVSGQHLHFADTKAGTDVVADHVAPIVNDDATLVVPFLVSGDGRFLATVRRTSLTVQDVSTGATRTLTEALDARRWSGYGWSPGDVLAYADVDSDRIPTLHLFDPTTGSDRILLQGKGSGVFSGVRWSTADWLIFVFYPSGTVVEELAEYRAINVTTGVSKLLFTNGLGFALSAGGRKLFFTRSASTTAPFSQWIATLVVQ